MLVSHIRHILVPVDLSKSSLDAWHQARELSGRLNAELEAVHVLSSTPRAVLRNSDERAKALPSAGESLRLLQSKLGQGARVRVLRGNPSRTILGVTRERGSNLIVMGTHGRTGVRRLLLGSVAEDVIARSPVPVLAVRGGSRPIRSILAPVSLTHYSVTGLAAAAKFAAALGADITILNLFKNRDGADPEALLAALIGRLPDGLRDRCVPITRRLQGEPAEDILAASRAYDLTVLVFHRKPGLQDWTPGTTLQQVLRRSTVPILAVPYLRPDSFERQQMLREVFVKKISG